MPMPLHLRMEQCIWDIASFQVVSLHKIQYHLYLPSYYELFSFKTNPAVAAVDVAGIMAMMLDTWVGE